MLRKIAIIGIAVGVLGLAGCQCEQEGEGQAVNTAVVDSLQQVISSLRQDLSAVQEEKQQCEAELESLRAQAQSAPEKKEEKSQPKKGKTKTVSIEDKVSLDKSKQVKNMDAPKKVGEKVDVPANLNK